METGRVNPNQRLEDQGITGLGHVYYNLLEPSLIQEALNRNEGTLGKGGTQYWTGRRNGLFSLLNVSIDRK